MRIKTKKNVLAPDDTDYCTAMNLSGHVAAGPASERLYFKCVFSKLIFQGSYNNISFQKVLIKTERLLDQGRTIFFSRIAE